MASVDDLRGGQTPGWNAPPFDAIPITASDTTADPNGPFRYLWCPSAVSLKVTTWAGTDRTITGIPAGTLFPIVVTRVWSTGSGTLTGVLGCP